MFINNKQELFNNDKQKQATLLAQKHLLGIKKLTNNPKKQELEKKLKEAKTEEEKIQIKKELDELNVEVVKVKPSKENASTNKGTKTNSSSNKKIQVLATIIIVLVATIITKIVEIKEMS